MAPTFIKLTKVLPGHAEYRTGNYYKPVEPEQEAAQKEFYVNMSDIVEMHPRGPELYNPARTELIRANGNKTLVLEDAAAIMEKMGHAPAKPGLRRVP
jgi:hypothetical protein